MEKANNKQIILPKSIFDAKVNAQTIFDVILFERASRRQGTHSTKSRGEVSGGGRKPFKQKKTGNARQGSIRSPQWVGGGVVGGPKPNRNYKLKVNKKVRQIAFASALTLKAKNKAIKIHDFHGFEKPNTKKLIADIKDLKLQKDFAKILIVTNDENIWKSAANLEKVFVYKLASLTIEMIVHVDVLVFSKNELLKLKGVS